MRTLTTIGGWLTNGHVALAIALALSALLAMIKNSRVLAVVLLIGAAVALAGTVVQEPLRWAWTLMLVPSAMVVDQAAFVAMVRKMPFPNVSDKSSLTDQVGASAAVLEQAEAMRDRFFGLDTLTLRYGLPALFLVIVGGAYTSLLCTPEPVCCGLNRGTEFFLAARLGLAGAYVYVILYLGQRAFRHDITSGAAMWSVATIALGPLLAAVTSLVVDPTSALAPGSGATGGATHQSEVTVTKAAIYFVAGLAPRYVAAFVQESVRRLMPMGAPDSSPGPRLLPLTQIRGINSDIQGRLSEEGILDGYGLAMADPLQLMRATNFDKRQILAWIDEALLALTLPEGWIKLENVGVTGAIDLAATYHSILGQAGAAAASIEASPRLIALAEVAGLKPVLMAQTMEHLAQDMQVQIIWTLYQTPSEADPPRDEKHRDGEKRE